MAGPITQRERRHRVAGLLPTMRSRGHWCPGDGWRPDSPFRCGVQPAAGGWGAGLSRHETGMLRPASPSAAGPAIVA